MSGLATNLALAPAEPATAVVTMLDRIVTTIIAGNVRPELSHPVTADAELEGDLLFDGLDRQSVALELDEAFGIEVTDAQLESWRTVADVIATVAGQLPPKCAALYAAPADEIRGQE